MVVRLVRPDPSSKSLLGVCWHRRQSVRPGLGLIARGSFRRRQILRKAHEQTADEQYSAPDAVASFEVLQNKTGE